MKKLLLGLGTVSLAILPVAAMVSCSTTETTLDTEATKFTVSLEAKTPATTTTEAVKSIMDGKDAPAKLLALETLVGKDKLPTIADGFTFEVKSAMVNSKTDTTVDVKITITETDSTETVKTKDATLSITKLTKATAPTTTLALEAAKYDISKPTQDKAITANGALALFVAADTSELKTGILETLVGKDNVPKTSPGFTFEVTTVVVGSDNTTVEVTITVTEIAGTPGSNTATGKMTITDFTTTLALEAAKYDIPLAVLPGEASKTSTDAAALFTGDAAAQLVVLKTLVGDNVPTTSDGFTFEVTGAVVGTVDTTVEVTITVTETAGTAGSNTATGKITITGLTTP